MRNKFLFGVVLVLLTFFPSAGSATEPSAGLVAAEIPGRSVMPLCLPTAAAIAPPAAIPPFLFLGSGFCQTSYCGDIGIRCVNVGSGKCPHCDYDCGPDNSCLGQDQLPTCH